MRKIYIVYCAYPYSDSPLTRTDEINEIARKLYDKIAGTADLVLLVPHDVFDKLYDFPPGYTHPEIALAELALISRCDIFAYDPMNISIGVNWEKSFAELIQKPVLTYAELLSGKRPATEPVNGMRFRKIIEEKNPEKGKKFDQGKAMVDLLIPEFIEDLARVLTMGAQKYGLENWKKNLEKRRILAALYRHLLKYHEGETYDEESKLNHLCHIAVNAMFLYYYDEIAERKRRLDYCPKCKQDINPEVFTVGKSVSVQCSLCGFELDSWCD